MTLAIREKESAESYTLLEEQDGESQELSFS